MNTQEQKNAYWDELELLEEQLKNMGGNFDNNGNRCDEDMTVEQIIERMDELEELVSISA